jgi:hypothetical protein
MNDSTQTLIRAVLKIGAGFMISKGFADENSMEAVTAGIVAAIAIVWGLLHRNSATKVPPLAIWLLVLLPLLPMAALSGCSTAPANTYKAVSASDVTLSAAMRAWGDYVAQNHPPASDEQIVKSAFEAYQQAELLALDAAAVAANAPDDPQALSNSQGTWNAASLAFGDLVNILEKFGVKIQP